MKIPTKCPICETHDNSVFVYPSNVDANSFSFSQQTYGFWAVPPDVGNFVLITFVMGDPSRGYWFACIPNIQTLHMVPGLARPAGAVIVSVPPPTALVLKPPAHVLGASLLCSSPPAPYLLMVILSGFTSICIGGTNEHHIMHTQTPLRRANRSDKGVAAVFSAVGVTSVAAARPRKATIVT